MPLSQSPFIRLCQREQLACLEIRHPGFSADLLLQGAQLLHFAPQGESNWLWLSEQARYLRGQSVRGGIPVCWPWFGNPAMNPEPVKSGIRTPHLAPAHGFARARDWRLIHQYEAADRVELTLALPDCQHPLWQQALTVQIHFTFTPHALSIELVTHNNAHQPGSFSQALHTYFPTDTLQATRIDGLHGCRYLDTLDGWQEKTQTGPVRFTAETDRIYYPRESLRLTTPACTLTLHAQGSQSAVVWNPWQRKSLTLSQFAPDAWQRMFCVETANAAADAITLAPGQQHRLSLQLSR